MIEQKNDDISNCASCHGADGSGNGPMAAELKHEPTDLTTLSKNNDGHFPCRSIGRVIDGSFILGQRIPCASACAVALKLPVFRQRLDVILDRIAASARCFLRFVDCHSAVFTRNL